MLTPRARVLARSFALASLFATAACSSRHTDPTSGTPAVGGNGAADPAPTPTPPPSTPTPTPSTPTPGAGAPGVGTPSTPDAGAPAAPDAGAPTAPDAGAPTAPDAGAPTAALPHRHCGWLGADEGSTGIASFVANADFFDAVHPVWYVANADGTVRSVAGFTDDATIVSTARAHHVALIPLVYGGDSASIVRTIFASPAAITAHVQVLAKLVADKGYDGLDLDYEHLWAATDRPGYNALVTQLAAALHAKGKVLTAAVSPAEVDYAGSAYDLPGMVAEGVDLLHLMGYDWHYLGGDHLGPLAPIGWIDNAGAYLEQKGIADRALLGIANYGIGTNWYADSASVVSQCLAGSYRTTTNHMLTCPYGVRTAGVSPHCTTARGDVWFEDLASVAEKVQVARKHGLRGITYFELGGELPGFFDTVRAAYP